MTFVIGVKYTAGMRCNRYSRWVHVVRVVCESQYELTYSNISKKFTVNSC